MDTLDRILNLIKQSGITQQALLKDLGFNKSFISDWRAGKIHSPSSDKISKIADYFDVSTDYLLGHTDNPAPSNSNEDDINLDELEFALLGEVRDLDDAEKEELVRMARRMRELREFKRKQKNNE